MSKVLEYQVSKQFLINEYTETGVRGKAIRTVDVPMESKEVRQAWGELFGLQDKIDCITKYASGNTGHRLYLIAGITLDNADEMITPAKSAELVLAWVQTAKDYQSKLQAEQADKEAEQARQSAENEALEAKFRALFERGDFETIITEYDKSSPFNYSIKTNFYDPAKKELQSRAKAAKEAEKRLWIELHGSPHLKRVYDEGHNAQRIYVTERSKFEFGDFYDLDFDDEAVISECYNPSVESVALLDKARALGGNPVIGWQTAPINPPDDVFSDVRYDENGDYIACEVVCIPHYLNGEYALIRQV